MPCDYLRHLLLRSQPHRLLDRATFVGIQHGDVYPLLLVNCRDCFSTLSVAVLPSEACDAWVRALVRPGMVLSKDDCEDVEPIRAWVPGALARAGLHLEEVPGGFRVCSTGRTPLAVCTTCGGHARAGHECPGAELIHSN